MLVLRMLGQLMIGIFAKQGFGFLVIRIHPEHFT